MLNLLGELYVRVNRIRTLQQDPTVTVVPADKGKAVVVMDTVE